jgi:hypothetical protein
MSTTAATRAYLETDPSVQQRPEILSAARSAVDFVKGLTAEAYPAFAGDLTLSLALRNTHQGQEFLAAHLMLMDDFGGKGFVDGIEPGEFLDPTSRERRMLRLWQNVMWNRYANLEERLEILDVSEEPVNAQS